MISEESYSTIQAALERAHGLAEERSEMADISRAAEELRVEHRAQQVARTTTGTVAEAVKAVLARNRSLAGSLRCVCGEGRWKGVTADHDAHEVAAAVADWLRARPSKDPEIRDDAGHWQRAVDWAADLLDGGRRG